MEAFLNVLAVHVRHTNGAFGRQALSELGWLQGTS
jgi:hypothetical protein